MKHSVKELLNAEPSIVDIDFDGWIRTRCDSKNFSFFEINDGSCLANIQIIADNALSNYDEILKYNAETSLSIKSKLAESPGKGQRWKVNATEIIPLDHVAEDYSLQKSVIPMNFYAA